MSLQRLVCKISNIIDKLEHMKMMKKKLKKIPIDLVSYIQIETEAIKDFNDKQMISSYCLGKLETVNWYLELLETGSKKYIVPQSKEHLQMIRDQLMECHKQIMSVKIKNPADRPMSLS